MRCAICKQQLDQPDDPSTRDCGGDCVRCMARYGNDPDCLAVMRALEPNEPNWQDDET
jgi:hypothetical protein